MRIKSVSLKNIGPYIDNNVFNFNTSDHTRRMVLIGGKNGAGKTTLFNAIKVGLYGCLAYGFESNSSRYFDEIEKLINTNERLKKIGKAQIIVELLIEDGKENHIYAFDRSWTKKGKRTIEMFSLKKDGLIVTEAEKSDFESYLLQILPPNLFRFYFFDGERISDFEFSGSKTSDFREAFLKLCNLDTLDIIQDNFRRISRGRINDTDQIAKEYEYYSSEIKTISDIIISKEADFSEIEREIALIDDLLSSLDKAYAKSGGITKKEWHSMEECISKEEHKREENRKWLKDIANNVLPFIILREQLNLLKERIAIEHKYQVDSSVRNAIDTPYIKELICGVLANAGVNSSNEIADKVIAEIVGSTSDGLTITPVLNLSDFDRYELIWKINSLLLFDVKRIKETTDEIESSLRRVKKIRKKIEQSSIEDYEGYLQKKSELSFQRSEKAMQLLKIDNELQGYRSEKAAMELKLAKAKNNYQELLRKQSINDISARALLAFDELQTTLYKRYICQVETDFKIFFEALINKSDLIDGIHVDLELNVHPYKNKKFKLDEVKQIIKQNVTEHLILQIGLFAYEVLQQKIESGEIEFELPVEVKQQLSAGEKQIFIMALYQALSRLNRVNVPYIIDTPFARIDSEHRKNILEHFFKKLNGQVIILSTDEEIVGEYCEIVSDMVSNTCVLKHASNGKTKILDNTYFGGKHVK